MLYADNLVILAETFECLMTKRHPWELRKKYDGNFIFTFPVVKVSYGGITTAKIFKHGNCLK